MIFFLENFFRTDFEIFEKVDSHFNKNMMIMLILIFEIRRS